LVGDDVMLLSKAFESWPHPSGIDFVHLASVPLDLRCCISRAVSRPPWIVEWDVRLGSGELTLGRWNAAVHLTCL